MSVCRIVWIVLGDCRPTVHDPLGSGRCWQGHNDGRCGQVLLAIDDALTDVERDVWHGGS
ncbi:hypothetical protein [Halocatena marina]|uniref:Uncharacterized protein n=1 Tax=Halocatena marina TaxID=2934937 RepID=A0ABD5YXP6_9EURY|nr:hypothetical protein [Halocatena marina]